jgi:hypothetical protein
MMPRPALALAVPARHNGAGRRHPFKGLRMFTLPCLCLVLLAAEPAAFECRWAESPVTIDGRADEAAWKNAQVIDHFYLPWLGKDARAARTATKARLLWDKDYLYFFADLEDHDLFADVKEHNGHTWDNDVFELFFKPAADKPAYFEFQVNAAGTIYDSYIPQGPSKQLFDGFHVEAKVVLRGTLNKRTDNDEGWSVEGRIPWGDFARAGGRPEPDARWKFTLCRYDYSVHWPEPELSTCAPLSKKNFHLTKDYVPLRFVGPPRDAPATRTPR